MSVQIQAKYVADLKTEMMNQCKFKDKIMLLSGGYDSLLLLLIAKDCFGAKNIKAYTFVGRNDDGSIMNTYDLEKATATAKELGISHTVFAYTKDQIINKFPSFAGTKMTKFFDIFSMAFFRLFLDDAKITNSDIIWGEGADRLYGSVSSYMYMDTSRIAKEKNITRIEAMNYLKESWFADKSNFSDDTYFYQFLKEGNNNVVTPYCSPSVEWINKVSADIIKPKTKGFVKETIMHIWPNLNEKIVTRKRTFMEGGTGLYEIVKEEMIKKYSHIGKSVNKIAQHFTTPSNQTALIP